MAVSYTQLIDYLSYRAGQKQIPLSGTFELTSRCNLNCKMCYIHRKEQDGYAKKQELSAEQWVGLAREAQQQGMLLLLLTGGEPFVREDFFEIYRGCKSLGVSLSINTNGTLLTASHIEKLCADPPARINLTLYGGSRDTYKKLCGDPNAYDRVMDAVCALQVYGLPLKLNYSVTPDNWQDFQTVCKMAAKKHIPLQAATYMFPPVRTVSKIYENQDVHRQTQKEGLFRLTPQEAAAAAFSYDCYRFTKEDMRRRCRQIQSVKIANLPEIQDLRGVANAVSILQKGAANLIETRELRRPSEKGCAKIREKMTTFQRENKTEMREKMSCRAGSTAFWINWNGQMQLCGMMDQPKRAVTAESFWDSWKQMRLEREKVFLPLECSHCEARSLCECCPAACYAEDPCGKQVPQYLCQKTQAYQRLAARYCIKN